MIGHRWSTITEMWSSGHGLAPDFDFWIARVTSLYDGASMENRWSGADNFGIQSGMVNIFDCPAWCNTFLKNEMQVLMEKLGRTFSEDSNMFLHAFQKRVDSWCSTLSLSLVRLLRVSVLFGFSLFLISLLTYFISSPFIWFAFKRNNSRLSSLTDIALYFSRSFKLSAASLHYITLHYRHFKRHLHLKWPVVHQQLHVIRKYSPPAQHAG